jgi:ribonuclease D
MKKTIEKKYTLYKNDLPTEVLKFLLTCKSVAIDTEYLGLKLQKNNLYLVQISAGDGTAVLVQLNPHPKYNCPNLKRLFTDKRVQKIFHYARADMGVLKMNLGINVQNFYCTKIASKIVRHDTEEHSLRHLVRDVCGFIPDKEQQLSDWSVKVLSEQQLQYAANDVLYLHQIQKYLSRKMRTEKMEKHFKKCLEFLPTQVDLDICGLQNVSIFSFRNNHEDL